ncbi:sigma 54-interacting transcriptional regulator [Peribacillus frigoritolerans]|nr:sigma 54-interacting transcriptional regulator [Peribacillus frigoritolerans]
MKRELSQERPSSERVFFEIAGNGTLFLDEIADASPAIQVKLLRVLETREFMRVGSSGTLRTNARLVAASNENLQQAVDKNKFREDLFYRLNVVTLDIPPLRNRKEDIPLLVRHLIERNGHGDISFSKEAIEKLQQYNWPGNIRELSNVVMRTLTLADNKSVITANDISLSNNQITLTKMCLLKRFSQLKTFLKSGEKGWWLTLMRRMN